ncbi:hypothetical protein L2E82_37431 [Cichorium intybus]|uniref:Uncharacterized protein n=1 Tax=Cichorium intybus TaxID=13427 RepID=A0ACB9AFH0_CICIN|nr:hypothetical protein L2E82_37431 [Cichorium intybus]
MRKQNKRTPLTLPRAEMANSKINLQKENSNPSASRNFENSSTRCTTGKAPSNTGKAPSNTDRKRKRDELDVYLQEHKETLYTRNIRHADLDTTQKKEFPSWFKTKMALLKLNGDPRATDDLYALSQFPDDRYTSWHIRNDVEPETLAHEAVQALRNEKVIVHNSEDIDDEYDDDDGRIFLDNEPILDSESDDDYDDPNRNNDDDSFA